MEIVAVKTEISRLMTEVEEVMNRVDIVEFQGFLDLAETLRVHAGNLIATQDRLLAILARLEA